MSAKYPGMSMAYTGIDDFGKRYNQSNIRKKRNIMRKRGLLKKK